MEFGMAKLPKTFYKNTEKWFKSKKKLSSIKDRKVNTSIHYNGRKSFVTRQIQCRHTRGLAHAFWCTKNTCFGASCNDKKSGNDTKRIINTQFYLDD